MLAVGLNYEFILARGSNAMRGYFERPIVVHLILFSLNLETNCVFRECNHTWLTVWNFLKINFSKTNFIYLFLAIWRIVSFIRRNCQKSTASITCNGAALHLQTLHSYNYQLKSIPWPSAVCVLQLPSAYDKAQNRDLDKYFLQLQTNRGMIHKTSGPCEYLAHAVLFRIQGLRRCENWGEFGPSHLARNKKICFSPI